MVGFDPIAWVDRLREVNRGSQFHIVEKSIIEAALRDLAAKLTKVRGVGSTNIEGKSHV